MKKYRVTIPCKPHMNQILEKAEETEVKRKQADKNAGLSGYQGKPLKGRDCNQWKVPPRFDPHGPSLKLSKRKVEGSSC